MTIEGVILAGGWPDVWGKAKPLITLSGKSILSRAIDALQPQCAHLAINVNAELHRYRQFKLPILIDTIDGFIGPLAGAFRWYGRYC